MKDGDGWRGGQGPGKAVHGSNLCLAQTAICVHHGMLMEGTHTSFLQKKCSICSIKIALLLGNSYKIAGSFINRCDSFS